MLCINKPPSEEKKVSQIIDNGLKSEKKRLERIQQILLLGTGESGKTTIIKQMKILHINGFSEQEKMEKVPNIKQNIHESIFTLIDNMDKISPPVDLEVEDNKKLAQYIRNIGPNPPTEYTNEYYDSIQSLWADPGVRKTYMRANEFQLIDSAAHFLDRINDIRDADYIPTVQDMLFCRVMTVSISKIEFKIPYKGQKVEFWMYDVGGQRGERKNGFRFVRKAGKIVFLNKQDILKKKIENGKKIEKHFPEFANFEKTKNDYDRAKLFMKNKILEIATTQPGTETVEFIPGVDIKQEIKSELLYIHFTIATDTNNVKLVFNDVKDIIIAINLETSGLV